MIFKFVSANSFVFVASVAILSACGNQGSDGAPTLNGNFQSAAAPLLGVSTTGFRGCSARAMNLEAGQMKVRQLFYADEACTQLEGEIVTEGEFRVGARQPGADVAWDVDWVVSKVSLLPATTAFSQLFAACLSTDPTMARVQDLAGRDCETMGKFPAAGSTFFASIGLNADKLSFTALPNELPANVAAAGAQAPRAQDRNWIYQSRN